MEKVLWGIKLSIDIFHNLAWIVIQKFGQILNYISIVNKLPIVIYPVSPPPYMNVEPNKNIRFIKRIIFVIRVPSLDSQIVWNPFNYRFISPFVFNLRISSVLLIYGVYINQA